MRISSAVRLSPRWRQASTLSSSAVSACRWHAWGRPSVFGTSLMTAGGRTAFAHYGDAYEVAATAFGSRAQPSMAGSQAGSTPEVFLQTSTSPVLSNTNALGNRPKWEASAQPRKCVPLPSAYLRDHGLL